MTLAKTCHANSMMQDWKKATQLPIASTKAFWITMFQYSNPLLFLKKKLNLILKTKVAMLNK